MNSGRFAGEGKMEDSATINNGRYPLTKKRKAGASEDQIRAI